MHACIHSFIHSFFHSFIHSFIHAFIHSFILSFIHSLMHLCIYFFCFFQIGIIKDLLNIPSYVLPMVICSPRTTTIYSAHPAESPTCLFPWIWSVGNLKEPLKEKKHLPFTVNGRNPKQPVEVGSFSRVFIGFYTFHVVQNFFHQQYDGSSG